MNKILIVEDEEGIRKIITRHLAREGYETIETDNGREALQLVGENNIDCVTLDFRLPGDMDGLAVLKEIKEKDSELPVIMVTGHGNIQTAVEAVREGAYDFITKPFDASELVLVVQRALQTRSLISEVKDLKVKLSQRETAEKEMLGTSKAIKDVYYKVEKVAHTDFTVLIQGESGTGKEVAAQLLYSMSNRKDKPFIHVDCGVIPENLIESELFGYEKGAFTGAVGSKEGQFELADKGTIFLDEISNLPYPVQSKLLRVLQNRVIRRLGGKADKQVDVRIIAATNEKLEESIKTNKFRSDLYYRLSEFVINIPPLSERTEDIPLLVEKFSAEAQAELGKQVPGFTAQAMQDLVRHQWKGNIRELKNVVRNAILMAKEQVQPADLIFNTREQEDKAALAPESGLPDLPASLTLKEIKNRVLAKVEKEAIERELKNHKGNKRKVAKVLDVDYTTLFYKIKNYGING